MSSSQYDWARNIPCRNIQIHGFCKFEHKGCSYSHDFKDADSSNLESHDQVKLDTGAGATALAKSDSVSHWSTLNFQAEESTDAASAPATTDSIASNAADLRISSNIANSSIGSVDVTRSLKAPAFKPTAMSVGLSSPVTDSQKFKVDSPAFTPVSINKFSALSPSLDNIPAFIPSASNGERATSSIQSKLMAADVDVKGLGAPLDAQSNAASAEPSGVADVRSIKSALPNISPFNPVAPMFTPQTGITTRSPEFVNSIQTPTGEDLFYQNTNLYPVNFLLYAPAPPPHINLNKKENERTVDDLFIDGKLREYLQLKNEESLKSVSSNEMDLPSHVGPYHSLYPIDKTFDYSSKSFGYTSIVYKCLSNVDGRLYTMRRLQNVPVTSPSVLKSVKKWKMLDCANCVKIYDAFTTRAFNDNSLILMYDYYPMSSTLLENHFMSFLGKNPELITEDSLWSYTIQLLNAITEVQKLGLKIGPMDSSKIIITNKGRIRLSALAIKDILHDVNSENKPDQNAAHEKKDDASDVSDLLHLGKLILFLAKSTTFLPVPTEDPSEIIMQLKFTKVFKKMLLYLFSEHATVERFQELVAPMILKLSNGLQNSCDTMEGALTTELENARLVRLFAKLDFISERPEMIKDGSWSETGERYPIKLFKDYVFHQVDENGKPVVDLTHVVNCLNKLDAGVDENLLLVSPDEMTCLVMSYKDLKDLINRSFMKLIGKD
jgi:PAB-dependent poly(A)-specific ribonuclease subunit 3